MRRAVIYILIFFLFIFITDNIIGVISYNSLPKIRYGFLGKVNSGLTDYSNLFILGSSRAMHHYNSRLIQQNLGLSVYNAGIGGYGLFLNYAMLSTRIEENKIPDIVILDIAPNVIDDLKSYEKLNSLLPFYKNYPSFKRIIKLNPSFTKLSLLFNTVVFNSTLYDFVKNLSFLENFERGYMPLKSTLDSLSFVGFHLENNKIDKNKLEIYVKLIDLCNKNNIRLFVVVSPCYEKFDVKNIIIDKFRGIAEKNDIVFYDFSSDTTFAEKAYLFKDQLHLNSKGANIFSEIISKKIKNDLTR